MNNHFRKIKIKEIMDEKLDSKIIEVNKQLYIDAEYILEYLKYIFDEIKDDASENVVENIEAKIDYLLEAIEFNDGEYVK
jgi:hypothetical protein